MRDMLSFPLHHTAAQLGCALLASVALISAAHAQTTATPAAPNAPAAPAATAPADTAAAAPTANAATPTNAAAPAVPANAAAPGNTAAASSGFRPEFRNLGLGVKADELSTEGFDSWACGSNGGPPLARLTGWKDYAQCAKDENGLHEVAVEFGTRTERISQLFQDEYGEELWIQQYGGTRIANFPVVLSLLFDDNGVARGFRAVTDQRANENDRGKAYLLRFRVYAFYGEQGWTCDERGPSNGRTPVGKEYVDEVCTKEVDGKKVRVEAHVFRRPGQTGVDLQGLFVPGQFESLTRWETWDASYPITEPDEN